MIRYEDILSLEFLKKTEYTGSHGGMRYRLEGVTAEEGRRLKATIWPEPFAYGATPDEQKQSQEFDFSEEGIQEAVDWMNKQLPQGR